MSVPEVPSVRNMRHDLREYLPEMGWREKVGTWLRFYFMPTHFWLEPLLAWWDERRYGPAPPLEKDRVALHYGFVEGVPPCADGPICAEHGWRTMPHGADERPTP